MKTRTLTIIFIALLVLFAASRLFRGHRESSFDSTLSTIDSAKVDRIKFISGGTASEEFELVRTGDTWEAVQGSKKIPAPARNVNGVIQQLAELNAQRLLTKDPTKYAEYEITDEQASKVIVWEGKKKVSELLIGGFKFDQASRSASSYVRKAGKPEVYLVDGFVSMSLKQRFNQYRDKKLVKVAANDLNKIEWADASGKIKAIEKNGMLWHYAGMEALDTTAINNYVTALANVQGSEFSEMSNPDGLNLLEQLTLYGNNMTRPTVITAFANPGVTKPFLIKSTANADGVFVSDSTGIYKVIFGDIRQFWSNGK